MRPLSTAVVDGRPGGARWWEDLALRSSCAYTDSALQSAAVCWELTVHQELSDAPFDCLNSQTLIRFVYRHDITIDLVDFTEATLPLLLAKHCAIKALALTRLGAASS